MRFAGELEREYLAQTLEPDLRFVQKIFPGLLVVCLVDTFVRSLVMGFGTARAFELTMGGVLAAGCVVCFWRPLWRYANALATVLLVAGNSSLILMLRYSPPEKRPFTLGLVYIAVALGAALPIRGGSKLLVTLWTFALFSTLAVADRVYAPEVQATVLLHLGICALVALGAAYLLERFRRQQFLLRREIDRERARSETLLLNTLPEKIAGRLKAMVDGGVIVDQFPEVSVVFADLVGFTSLASTRAPQDTVRILNDLFSRFDAAAHLAGVEKIKTIGDAYMAVAGVPEAVPDSPARAVAMALEMRDAVRRYRLLTGLDLEIRIGVHTGPVAAGVIGTRKYQYDLWGDTVNVAARLESHGLPGQIQVSEATKRGLEDRYRFTSRGRIALKGMGEMEAFLLEGPRLADHDSAA